MASSRSVMEEEGILTEWSGQETSEYGVSTQTPAIRNVRESTGVACPDEILPGDNATQLNTALNNLARLESSVNGKHFIITQHAEKYLDILNSDNASYTNATAQKTLLFCANLQSLIFKPSSQYKIELVNSSNVNQCRKVAEFQRRLLFWFRRLADRTILEKTQARYADNSFMDRVSSPGVFVFTIGNSEKLLGTFTLNLHAISSAPQSDEFGYLSDLFVEEGLDDDADFNVNLIGGVFAKIKSMLPSIRIATVMAGTNNEDLPIVKCFNHAKNAGLLQLFTRELQQKFGVVAHFTYDLIKFANNQHLPAVSPRTVYSLFLFPQKATLSNSTTKVEARELEVTYSLVLTNKR